MNKYFKNTLKISLIIVLVFSLIFSKVMYINASTEKKRVNINNPIVYNSWFTFNNELILNSTLSGPINGMTKYVFELYDSENVKHFSNTINYIWDDGTYLYYSIRIYDTFIKDYNSYDVQVYKVGEGWLNQEYRFMFVNDTEDYIGGDFLESNGVWDYISTLPESSLSDMIYSVVDVIPKTIQSMTSVEILGTTLFAILGTIVLIMVIVKIVGTIG